VQELHGDPLTVSTGHLNPVFISAPPLYAVIVWKLSKNLLYPQK
jgi:hypothetical protein